MIDIQAALDKGGIVILPRGTYYVSSTLYIKSDSTALIGEGASLTTIVYTGQAPVIQSDTVDTKTKYWCKLRDLRIVIKNEAFQGDVIDWSSQQFSIIENIWIAGNGLAGTIGIKVTAIAGITEATYNVFRQLLIGIINIGMSFSNRANSNTVELSRFQPTANGVGIKLDGHVNNTRIINNGFEYPGQVSGGILIEQNILNTVIQGNRFEHLAYAWKINNSSSSDTFIQGNYYSSIGNK